MIWQLTKDLSFGEDRIGTQDYSCALMPLPHSVVRKLLYLRQFFEYLFKTCYVFSTYIFQNITKLKNRFFSKFYPVYSP